MFIPRILSTALFVLTSIFSYSQAPINERLSNEIRELNQQAFDLSDSDLSKAKRLNDIAFSLLKKGGNAIDTIVRSDVFSAAGNIASQRAHYDQALDYFLISLKIRKTTKNTKKIADMTKNVANMYVKTKLYRKAILHYRQSLFIRKNLKEDKTETIAIYDGLGLAFEGLYKKDSALHYYNKALDLVKNIPDLNHDYISALYMNIGQFYENTEQYNQAIQHYKKALSIQQKTGNRFDMAWTYHHLGIVSDYQKRYSDSKTYYNLTERIAIEQMDTVTLRDVAESYMLLYAHLGNEDSTTYYFEKVKLLNEHINEREIEKNTLELATKYDTELKDKKIQVSELERRNQEEQKEYMQLGIILGSIIILTIFYFLIRTYRQKQRIILMNLDLKSREIDDLLNRQESAVYAAMLEGQDQERFRIARDLHDRLGSTLAAVKLGLQGNPEVLGAQNQQLVDAAITEVRAIAHDLSGMNIERYGLNVALYELKIKIERTGKINLDLYLDEQPLGIELSIELYRIVQELVSNTLKHAEARTITIQTSNQSSNFNLIYEDDGVGFDPATVSQGMGIRNIRHRLDKLEGTLDIDSQPGRGSILNINIALNSPK